MSIKGVCANRYLAMKEDGRLLASVSTAPVSVAVLLLLQPLSLYEGLGRHHLVRSP